MRTVDVGHGRIETRQLTTSEALVGYSDWPGLAQVFEVGRHVITKKTGQERAEVVYGVTSLSPEQADPGRLLELVRGHWGIENKSHWVRDVTFDEDRSQVRRGNIPQLMAALRNMAIGLLRKAGYTNITTSDGIVHGQVKQAGKFAFARIYESGHEVPFYQPVVALEVFERAIKGLDIATGKTVVGAKYLTKGTAKSTYREGNSTIQFKKVGADRTYNTTTNKPPSTANSKLFLCSALLPFAINSR